MFAHRPLREEDLDTIASFPQSAEELFYVSPRFRFPLSADQIVKLLENRHAPTVVVDEASGKAVGYANLYDLADAACWLGNVIVSRRFRGSGAADMLIETMKRQAKASYGVKRLLLSCHQTNARGLAFYHKHGFKPFDLNIVHYEDKGSIITIQMGIDL